MKLLLKTFSLTYLILFLMPEIDNKVYAQKGSVRYSHPEKDTNKDRKKLMNENKAREKQRARRFKDRGLGADKKSLSAPRKANRKKEKTGTYLDRVLTDKASVSSQAKQEAYRRDREISKGENRKKYRLQKNRLPKKRKPSRGN
jgi:hypothetical protein